MLSVQHCGIHQSRFLLANLVSQFALLTPTFPDTAIEPNNLQPHFCNFCFSDLCYMCTAPSCACSALTHTVHLSSFSRFFYRLPYLRPMCPTLLRKLQDLPLLQRSWKWLCKVCLNFLVFVSLVFLTSLELLLLSILPCSDLLLFSVLNHTVLKKAMVIVNMSTLRQTHVWCTWANSKTERAVAILVRVTKEIEQRSITQQRHRESSCIVVGEIPSLVGC